VSRGVYTPNAGAWKAEPLLGTGLMGRLTGALHLKLPRVSGSAIHALFQAGTFERRDGSHISWQPLSVDERGWSEISDIIREVEAQFKAVANKSRRRLKDKDGFPVVVVAGTLETAGTRPKKQ
jgi:hypothetical protein